MLALDSSRQQHFPYFSHDQVPLDSSVMDSYAYQNMHQSLHSLPQPQDPTAQALQHSNYYDGMYTADMQNSLGFPAMPNSPPSMAPSHHSGASGPSISSAPSSVMGSPYSGTFQESWADTSNGLVGLPSGALMNEVDFNSFTGVMEADSVFAPKYANNSFVDPSLIHQTSMPPPISYPEDPQGTLAQSTGFLSPAHVGSPLPSHHSMTLPHLPQNHGGIPSPQLGHVAHSDNGLGAYERGSNAASLSPRSHPSPAASNTDGEDEGREKSRCPFPDCGKSFKDLKAHMLTHQSERPEKCPIVTCDYHQKGFARKYDKNRHTLTHYKGTMVCGFCPGSGSAAEKSFNRADVFKRHLMSVHGVEQTAPNCRKRSPPASGTKTLAGYSDDATGKCSTCSATFSNAQDFYEHLDDCVLRVVQQEEPSEAINQKRLAEVAGDEDVKQTMEKHKLLDSASPMDGEQCDDDNDDDHDDDDEFNVHNKDLRFGRGSLKSNNSSNPSSRCVRGPNAAVTKSKPRPATRRRGNRNSYPQSWGTPAAKMKTKKRVLCVYDGQRRLWKDEMMLDNEFEVRIRLPGGAGDGTNRDAYVTDLDVMSIQRADGIYSATAEERGPWMDNSSDRLMGQPVTLFPEINQVDEIDIEELMAYREKDRA
ncbi:hypothetical protein BGW36DRAFT_425845 [Talaromyces proteolyticus]|uniref:C2H2-type domain-containing protein n=1 Tax=Talaromyces proteolyticus TaxID=1131652 RepID=A0AAD4KW25_9EURO|nr:uncharacterized protein BGW36DRAFT_425845 [Talaromyces proteolyticus]KAH8701050.1 hypothetical protein BGW36DRAFT_425845 [Talaromyces proteolyticus]